MTQPAPPSLPAAPLPLPPDWLPILLVIASAIEAKAVLAGLGLDTDPAELHWRARPISPSLDVVMCGIGKSNAAAATALCLHRRDYRSIISIGIAGALPASDLTLRLSQAVVGTRCVYADEGIQTPDSFIDCAAMGFPLGPFDSRGVECDPALRASLRPLVDAECPIATVSTCSGTDSLAQTVHHRTGALAECMEGAAVAHIAAAWPTRVPHTVIRIAELRVISNTTGNRSVQQWAMKPTLHRLSQLAADLRRLFA